MRSTNSLSGRHCLVKSQCVQSISFPFQSEAIYSFEKATSALDCSSPPTNKCLGSLFLSPSLRSAHRCRPLFPELKLGAVGGLRSPHSHPGPPSRTPGLGRMRAQPPEFPLCFSQDGQDHKPGGGGGGGRAGAHQNHVNQFSRISQVGFPRTHTRQEGLTIVQASHSPVPLCVSCLGRGGLNESWASLCHLKTRSRVNGFQKLSCFIRLTCGNVFFN